jgi:hypothetical protein
MRRVLLVTATLVVAAGSLAIAQRITWSFDEGAPGRPPAGFEFGEGSTRGWQIVRDGANSVLLHASPGRAGVDIATVEGTAPANVAVSARLRFPDDASAAGIVWRYRDADNYHAVVLDLRAQNVRIYRVAGGNRARLEDEDDLELEPAAWHTVKVEDAGMRMRVWIDGVPVAGARDRMRAEPGAVGLWSAGDARVWFDDLHVEPVSDVPRSNRRD